MVDATLALVLQRSVADKLEWLGRVAPGDAAAIALLIDDCITHRWPATVAEWLVAAAQMAVNN